MGYVFAILSGRLYRWNTTNKPVLHSLVGRVEHVATPVADEALLLLHAAHMLVAGWFNPVNGTMPSYAPKIKTQYGLLYTMLTAALAEAVYPFDCAIVRLARLAGLNEVVPGVLEFRDLCQQGNIKPTDEDSPLKSRLRPSATRHMTTSTPSSNCPAPTPVFTSTSPCCSWAWFRT